MNDQISSIINEKDIKEFIKKIEKISKNNPETLTKEIKNMLSGISIEQQIDHEIEDISNGISADIPVEVKEPKLKELQSYIRKHEIALAEQKRKNDQLLKLVSTTILCSAISVASGNPALLLLLIPKIKTTLTNDSK
ncbi:MAG: hypothetical protein ACOCV1_03050 [Bacillota bacterium]